MKSILKTMTAMASAVMLTIGMASAQDAPGVSKDKLTIGAWVALSGPVAIYGVPLKAGAQAYLDRVNAEGGVNGRKIEWIVDDNAYNPQQSVAVARKLITRDNVFAIVIGHGTAQSAATFPYVIDQAKVPFVVPYGGAPEWYNPPRPGLLGLHVLYDDQANALGRWAAQTGAKKILVVHGTLSSFDIPATFVKPGAEAVNKDVEVELMAVKNGTSDYGPIIVDIMNKKPDAIVSIQLQQETVLLAKGLRQQNQATPIFAWAPTASQTTIALGGEFVEGLRSVSITNPPTADTPAMQEYRDDLAKYAPSEKPDFASLSAYGAMKVFVEALKNSAEPLTRESLVEGFYKLKGYDSGIFPPVTYSAEQPLGGHILFPLEVKGGKWVSAGEPVDVANF